MSVEFKIGADPEFFLLDKETGKHVSAHGMIKGTKKNPLKVDGGAVQVDGMALEFNIDPVTNADDFCYNIELVLSQLRDMIDDRYEFSFVPVAEFGKDYIDAQPKAAKELGCDPDYNAYTGQPNPMPNGNMGIRTASGHIHIGWTEGMNPNDPGHFEACQMLAKQFDFTLGIGSMVWDRDRVRNSMYGKPGAFRPKPYGMEYRVLSNAWVAHPELRKVVAKAAIQYSKSLLEGSKYYYSQLGLTEQEQIMRDINSIIEGRWSMQEALAYLPHSDYLHKISSVDGRHLKFSDPVNFNFDQKEKKADRKVFGPNSIIYDELDDLEELIAMGN